jgi:hypothetical protein
MALALVRAFLGHTAHAHIQKHEVIYKMSRAYPEGPVELVPANNAKTPSITLADWLGAAAR